MGKTRVKVTVKDKDLGLRATLRAARVFAKGEVLIGVFGDTGGDVVLRASVHEFGSPTRNIPQRSFLRSTIDEMRSKYIAEASKLASRLLAPTVSRAQVLRGLVRLGMMAVSDVRRKIRSRIPPPLKKATIDAKGSSVPLIDTGRLIQAITHKVTLR